MKGNKHIIWRNYYNLYFTTVTIVEWHKLLEPDKYKEIILNSLRFTVEQGRARIYAFVIMPNHLHILWEIIEPQTLGKVRQSFLKYTAQQIKFDLMAKHPKVLAIFKVDKKDRQYQIWQRNPLSIEVITEAVFRQKIEYIHLNPCTERWKLAEYPEEYFYSSAAYYATGVKNWDFLV